MGQKRYTVRDAATHLGISESAVRNRLSRGTLTGVREGGATYVVLEDVTTDTDDIPPTDAATDHRDELIEELRDRVRSLEEANRENRRIIMQQAQNLAAIEAPEESVSPATQSEEPPADSEGSRRPWWRRLLGG
jgi:predicted transcriptional regulator